MRSENPEPERSLVPVGARSKDPALLPVHAETS